MTRRILLLDDVGPRFYFCLVVGLFVCFAEFSCQTPSGKLILLPIFEEFFNRGEKKHTSSTNSEMTNCQKNPVISHSDLVLQYEAALIINFFFNGFDNKTHTKKNKWHDLRKSLNDKSACRHSF